MLFDKLMSGYAVSEHPFDIQASYPGKPEMA